ncbi:hypothetical protein K1719_039564 [Acacia pycnantha]|nr:hypothetical protein K1719_039564 [Acacia pycnantha]
MRWVLRFGVGMDGKKLEPESNVLLVSIENMQYVVTLDVLHMVFFFWAFKRLQCLTRMLVYWARFNTNYTNPYLPVASLTIDGSGQFLETCVWVLRFGVGMDGKKLEHESNVLLVSIENMQYVVTLDVLHMVFSSFGPVKRLQCLTRMLVYRL